MYFLIYSMKEGVVFGMHAGLKKVDGIYRMHLSSKDIDEDTLIEVNRQLNISYELYLLYIEKFKFNFKTEDDLAPLEEITITEES